jgi:hypothetical protein
MVFPETDGVPAMTAPVSVFLTVKAPGILAGSTFFEKVTRTCTFLMVTSPFGTIPVTTKPLPEPPPKLVPPPPSPPPPVPPPPPPVALTRELIMNVVIDQDIKMIMSPMPPLNKIFFALLTFSSLPAEVIHTKPP